MDVDDEQNWMKKMKNAVVVADDVIVAMNGREQLFVPSMMLERLN